MNEYEQKVKEIIEKIIQERKKKKVSQKDIADKLGITQGAYSDMEKGKINFTAARLFQVCDILEIENINNSSTEGIDKLAKDIETIKTLLKEVVKKDF